MNREELISKFQRWLDTNPSPSLIAAECATIAEKYAEEKLNELLSNKEGEEEWVSVEKDLPKAGIPVIIYGINPFGRSKTLRAFYAPRFTLDGNNYEGDADYSEDKDDFFLPEGWYEMNEYENINWYIDFKPTHWKPLPTPPNER